MSFSSSLLSISQKCKPEFITMFDNESYRYAAELMPYVNKLHFPYILDC